MINKERVLSSFLSLVQIDSESKNERAVGEYLAEQLRALGLEVITDHAGETYGSNGFNILARLSGEGEPILLSAHMDTVTPGIGVKPVVRDGVVYSDGTTILGSDDKSGVCTILEAVQTVVEQKIPHRPVEIMFSIGEELGMLGVKAFDCSQLKSRRAYIFDSGGEVGYIITQAPGQVKIFADVYGKSAHAGAAPETGISAIQVAAHAVSKMKLLRIDEETTCNIGTFHAEYATNIVPDHVHLMAEVRSRDLGKLNAQVEHMRACLQEACDAFGAKLSCELRTNYVTYKIPSESETVKAAIAAVEKIGCKAEIRQGGGGSDANIYNQRGLEAIVLSTGMSKAHTKEECIKVENLEKTAALALELIKA